VWRCRPQDLTGFCDDDSCGGARGSEPPPPAAHARRQARRQQLMLRAAAAQHAHAGGSAPRGPGRGQVAASPPPDSLSTSEATIFQMDDLSAVAAAAQHAATFAYSAAGLPGGTHSGGAAGHWRTPEPISEQPEGAAGPLAVGHCLGGQEPGDVHEGWFVRVAAGRCTWLT
jgi:hypothetical protein